MSDSYLLLMPNDDAEPCTFIDRKKLDEILENPEEYGIRKFRTDLPDKDPMYWEDGMAMILEVKILKPKVIATAFRLE